MSARVRRQKNTFRSDQLTLTLKPDGDAMSRERMRRERARRIEQNFDGIFAEMIAPSTIEALRQKNRLLREIGELLDCRPNEVPARVADLVRSIEDLRGKLS